MPIYEYRCRRCGHVTSFLESMNAHEAHKCEECGSAATEKIFSVFAAKVSDSGATSCGTGTCPTGTCPLS